MEMKKKILAVGLLMAMLSACNLSAPGNPTSIPWDTLRVFPTNVTLPSGGNIEPSSTATQGTPTISPTPTENPLGIPRLEPGTKIDILQLDMIDAGYGWGIGGPRASGTSGHVFRTQDGGNSWIEVTPPEVADSTSEATSTAAIGYFADAQTGWVTYHAGIPSSIPENPVVWKTVDGGATWQAGSPLDTSGFFETYWVSHIVFTGAENGWVLTHVGAGMNHDYVALYRTTDGGSNWSRVIDPEIDGGIQSCTKVGIAFSDGVNGWLTGDCNGVRPGAFLFQTNDGGVHWESVSLAAPAAIADLFTADRYACAVHAPFLLADRAFLGVECTDMGDLEAGKISYLYYSVAGSAPAPKAYPGGDLFTLDGNRIWALGKEIYRSDTAGGSWSQISTVTWDAQFDFVTADLGWAAVRKGSEYGLVQTTDGGSLWMQLSPVVVAWP